MYYQWKVIFDTGEIHRGEFHDSLKDYFKRWINRVKGELVEFEITTEGHKMKGIRKGGEFIVQVDSKV